VLNSNIPFTIPTTVKTKGNKQTTNHKKYGGLKKSGSLNLPYFIDACLSFFTLVNRLRIYD
jgi:hypothetical protein